jgi:6-pyruvoyltetrahydropterin/6-carboxytetrahydropterin synthase
MAVQYITRKGSFDSGHRVMNERVKCFSIHGHTFLYEITFGFNQVAEIGYALDFKEIKRVGCQWIEDVFDHGLILNPCDNEVIKAAQTTHSKLWLMSLNGENNYCNPTVENIAKEIFLAMEVLFANRPHINVFQIRLGETLHCYTDCFTTSISQRERENFFQKRLPELKGYRQFKGEMDYDDRYLTRS